MIDMGERHANVNLSIGSSSVSLLPVARHFFQSLSPPDSFCQQDLQAQARPQRDSNPCCRRERPVS